MFERSNSICFPSGQAVNVITTEFQLPNADIPLELEAWQSAQSYSNILIFDGVRSLADVEYDLSQLGGVDCLMCLAYSGPSKVRLPPDTGSKLTVYADTQSNNLMVVTLTIRERMHK